MAKKKDTRDHILPTANGSAALLSLQHSHQAIGDGPSGNLPHFRTPLVGRSQDVHTVLHRLLGPTVGLLTLTGTGGVGKTRLALAVGAEALQHFDGEVHAVFLASINSPELVGSVIAQKLGVKEQGARSLTESLIDYLGDRRVLLILDNFEHVLPAGALVADLLAAYPDLKILVTSRAPLHLYGEHEFPVNPLKLPVANDIEHVDDLQQCPSVELFIQRARAVQPGFTLSETNAAAVAEICLRLDGLPLAIELAAARVKLLSPEAILSRLRNPLNLLTGGPVDLPRRHQTLRGAIDGSYQLLKLDEQALFCRLALCVGGISIGAAVALDDIGDPISLTPSETCERETLERLGSLMDKGLLYRPNAPVADARFGMLRTIRDYGLERLTGDAQIEPMRERHAGFYLALAEAAQLATRGSAQEQWLETLEVEHDNLREALQWSLDTGHFDTAVRLTIALWPFWQLRGHYAEGRQWLTEVLSHPIAEASRRADVLTGAGTLAWSQGDYVQARVWHQDALDLYRALGDQRGIAFALNNLGVQVLSQGDYQSAEALYHESLALYRSLGDHQGIPRTLNNLGVVAQYQAAYERAGELYQESLALYRDLGDKQSVADVLYNLGEVEYARANYAHAARLFSESLVYRQALGFKWGIAGCLASLANLALVQGHVPRAARLGGAAEALLKVIGIALEPIERSQFERTMELARRQLSEAAYAKATTEGRDLPLEQVIAEAIDVDAGGSEEAVPTEQDIMPAVEKHAELRISGLGTTEIVAGGRRLTAGEWTYGKPKELLFYLVCHTRQTKEQIGLALWPDASASQLRSNFRTALYHLRRALGRSEYIVFEDEHYFFNRTFDYWFDVEAFERTLADLRRSSGMMLEQRLHYLEEAVSLYRGDFLADMDVGEWCDAQRGELRRKYLEALLDLGHVLISTEQLEKAAETYRKVIALDSYSEEAHRGLMRLYAAQGERGQALRHYQALTELLQDELGVAPSPETQAVYDRLLRDGLLN